jgi:cytochrome c oxidase subunit IV
MTETQEARDLQAPHVKWTKYVGVAVVLAAITAIEIGAAAYMRGNPAVAGIVTPLLIGFTLAKAAMVMLFYMHLKYDTRWYSLVLVFPLFMVTVLMIIVLVAAASWNIV